jgi:hypothetical protein
VPFNEPVLCWGKASKATNNILISIGRRSFGRQTASV